VGQAGLTTYGGMSGNANRPIALAKVSQICNALPGFPVMATGGVESAETALQFLHCGASLVQVCSAIQNQDLSVVQDYITGLKALLYLRSCPELKEWLGPSPPSEEVPHIPNGLRDIEDMCRKQGLPRFGPYLKRRNATRAEAIKTLDYSASPLASYPPLPVPQSVPKIRDEIGRALPSIKNWGDLPIREQVIAVVDQDKCINCGKCYLTCSDAAYQAIEFNAETHKPLILDLCTGCGLCAAVCPIPDCITFVPRSTPFPPQRGVPPTERPAAAHNPFDAEHARLAHPS